MILTSHILRPASDTQLCPSLKFEKFIDGSNDMNAHWPGNLLAVYSSLHAVPTVALDVGPLLKKGVFFLCTFHQYRMQRKAGKSKG